MTTEENTKEKAPSALRLAHMHHKSADQQLLIAKMRPKESDYWLKEANISRMRAFQLEEEARLFAELGLKE